MCKTPVQEAIKAGIDRRTCAQMRQEARDLQSSGHWGSAAIMWHEAHLKAKAHYPASSELGKRDVAALLENADECAQHNYRLKHADFKGEASALAMCPFSGATTSIPRRYLSC